MEGRELCILKEVAVDWEAGFGVRSLASGLGFFVVRGVFGEGDSDIRDPITVVRVDLGADCSEGGCSGEVVAS